jgi:hypothetical protein
MKWNQGSACLPAEAGIFLDLFCLGSDEMVIPPKAGRKVTQDSNNKQEHKKKKDCCSRSRLSQHHLGIGTPRQSIRFLYYFK